MFKTNCPKHRIFYPVPEETSIRMTDPEFRAAYEQNKDMLYRFAWRMTGSPIAAEDIVHDCFLALLAKSRAYVRPATRNAPAAF